MKEGDWFRVQGKRFANCFYSLGRVIRLEQEGRFRIKYRYYDERSSTPRQHGNTRAASEFLVEFLYRGKIHQHVLMESEMVPYKPSEEQIIEFLEAKVTT